MEQSLEESFAIPSGLMSEQLADSGLVSAPDEQALRFPDPEPTRWGPMPEAEEASGRLKPLLPSTAPTEEALPPALPRTESPSLPSYDPVLSASTSAASEPALPVPLAPLIAALWRTYYDEGPAAALPHFLSMLSSHPERADLHLGVGLCLWQRDELEQAALHFDRAAMLEPANPTHGFYRAVVAYQVGHFREALARFETLDSLLEQQPLSTLHRDQRWLMGRSWLALGDRTRAEQAFQEAFARGAELPNFQLQPPTFPLEWTRDGLLPGASFEPVGGRSALDLGAGLLLETGGSIWLLEGRARLRERLTWNPPGWQDLAPTWDPNTQRLAFLSRDQEGRHALMIQGPDGQRQRLLSEPVAPVRPTFSRDGTLLAYVAFVGEPAQPRAFLLRLSTGDKLPVLWPDGAVAELAFSPLNRLVLSVEDPRGIYRLAEVELGASQGVWLEPFPPQRTEKALEQAGMGRVPEPLQNVRLPTRRPSAPPQRVREPWDSRPSVLEPPPPPGEARSLESQVQEKRAMSLEERKKLVAQLMVEQNLAPRPVLRMGKGGSEPAAEARGNAGERSPTDVSSAGTASAPAGGSSSVSQVADEASMRMGETRAPAFSARPESTRLVFVRQEGGRRVVYQRDAALRQEQRLSPVGLDCFAPTVRPDDLEVAFVCRGLAPGQEGQGGLYVRRRLSSDVERVVAEPLPLRGLWWKEAR